MLDYLREVFNDSELLAMALALFLMVLLLIGQAIYERLK